MQMKRLSILNSMHPKETPMVERFDIHCSIPFSLKHSSKHNTVLALVNESRMKINSKPYLWMLHFAIKTSFRWFIIFESKSPLFCTFENNQIRKQNLLVYFIVLLISVISLVLIVQ